MSYTAYERTSPNCMQEVVALERHLSNNGVFDGSTNPTVDQVEKFITDTYDEIGLFLVEFGYAKTQTNQDVLGVLQYYNALGAACKCELTQPSVGYRANENTRYYEMKKMYMKVREIIQSVGFQRLGATRSWEQSAALSAGGVSISDKEDIETDSDHEPYFFTRDLHRHPESVTQAESEYD
ncbi:MAG: hypothetical protein ACFFD4_07545 [Candidatus Odinarchaeota archaeon]